MLRSKELKQYRINGQNNHFQESNSWRPRLRKTYGKLLVMIVRNLEAILVDRINSVSCRKGLTINQNG